MKGSLRTPLLVIGAAWLAAAFALAAGERSVGSDDPLGDAILRGRAYVTSNRDSSDLWMQVKGASLPMYDRTVQALHDGQRLLALQRLSAARLNPAAWAFTSTRPATAIADSTGWAAAWRNEGDSLGAFVAPRGARHAGAGGDPAARLENVRPAAVRALAELAIPQVRNFYEAAYDYASSTQPVFGWFYVGAARAQRDFYDLCLQLGTAPARPEPRFRAIGAELDSLHARVLSAYRPPLSIDHHPEFIGVSSAIKEARELDDAGLHRGALLRAMTALQRFATLHPLATLDSVALAARLARLEARLAVGGMDHSLGELFLQSARSEIAAAKPGEVPPLAVVVAEEVLPFYFAAIAPAPAPAARPKPEATVTLVRWPYT